MRDRPWAPQSGCRHAGRMRRLSHTVQICQGNRKEAARAVTDRVEALIRRLSPAAICDPCIAERLALTALHHASQRTRELAGMGGYERSEEECALCRESQPVTRRKRRG